MARGNRTQTKKRGAAKNRRVTTQESSASISGRQVGTTLSCGAVSFNCCPGQSSVPQENHKPYLELSHVSKSFGPNQVLDDLSLDVARGLTLCILGRSGVGKSVCLRLMMGFLKPDAGRVVAAGEDITFYSEEKLQQIHKKITMVFQSGALFDSLTVRENVAFPLREQRNLEEDKICRRVDELLEMVRAREIADVLPSDISTGMKRSVAVARALAANPEAVLYDEPTTMVDPLTSRRLISLIADLKSRLKLTSMIVTHDTRLAEKLADHVIFLDQAKIVFFGTVTEMQHSSVPTVKQFLELDRLDWSLIGSGDRLVA